MLRRKMDGEWSSDTHGARLTITSKAQKEVLTDHQYDKGLISRIRHQELSKFKKKANPQKREKGFQ